MAENITNKQGSFVSRWWGNLTPNTKVGLKVFGGILLLGAVGAATVVSLGAAGVITAAGAAGLSGTGAAFGGIGTAVGLSGSAAITAGAVIVGASVVTGAMLAGGTAAVVSDINDGNPERDLRREVNKLMDDNKKLTLRQNLDVEKPRLLEGARSQGAVIGQKRADKLVRQLEAKIDNAHISSSAKWMNSAKGAANSTTSGLYKAGKGSANIMASGASKMKSKATPNMKIPSFAKKVANNNTAGKSAGAAL